MCISLAWTLKYENLIIFFFNIKIDLETIIWYTYHEINLIGVEGVTIDMAKNEVTIKGVVEPQAVCSRIMKKTKRKAKVLSPLPEVEGEPIPEVVASQVFSISYFILLIRQKQRT